MTYNESTVDICEAIHVLKLSVSLEVTCKTNSASCGFNL